MKHFILPITLFFAALLSSQTLFALKYTMDNGLSANRVGSIVQDSVGFIWIGTDDGLNRFDGVNFKQYKLSDYLAMRASNSVQKLMIDQQGKMWVALDDGVVLYDSYTDTFERFDAATSDGEHVECFVRDIVEDKDGEVWMATITHGVYRYDPKSGSLRVYNSESGLPQNSLLTICADSRDGVWIGTYSEGVCHYIKSEDRFVTYRCDGSPHSISDNSIQKIFEDSHGNLWMGTFQNGLDLFDESTEKFYNYSDVNSEDKFLYHIHDIIEYLPGKLLVASDNGAHYFDTATKKIIRSDDPSVAFNFSSDRYIYTMFIDSEESLWLGSYFSGVEQFSIYQNNFSNYSCNVAPSQHGRVVNSIIEGSRGKYWIGTDDDGIYMFDHTTQRVSPFFTAEDIGNSYYCIHDLLLDGDKLYAATYERGLEVFDLKSGTRESYLSVYGDEKSISSSKLYKLYKASNGVLYIGTSNGVCVFDKSSKTFRRLKGVGGIVSTIIEDHRGVIWCGSDSDGLMAYNVATDRVTIYRHSESNRSLPKNRVSALAIDSQHRMWVGTFGQGLCMYNAESDDFTRYDTLELPNQVVSSIIPIGERLWITTNKGLVAYDPDSDFMKVYTKANGIYNEQFTPGAALRTSDGVIVLGSADGFCTFNPNRLKTNRYIAPVVMTSMYIYGKQVGIETPDSPLTQSIYNTKRVVLDHDQSQVAFDFVVMSYIAPLENQYMYRMVGVDKSWMRSKGMNNHITYSNLPPGEYQFQVRGANSDAIGGGNYINLEVIVKPPFMRSTFAYLLYILCFLMLVYLFLKLYLHRNNERQREVLLELSAQKERALYDSKIEFFTNIAHEIRTPLSLIIGPLEHLMKTSNINREYGDYLTIIEQNYKRLYILVNQLLDFRKVDSGAYTFSYHSYVCKDLMQRVCQLFELTVKQRGLELEIRGVEDGVNIVTDEEAFVKILSNLLSNAVKYANKRVVVEFSSNTDEDIVISVIDDGVGINESEKGKLFNAFYTVASRANKAGVGIGLHMTQALVEQMGGFIYAENRCDGTSGAHFKVTLPLLSAEAHENKEMVALPEPDGAVVEVDVLEQQAGEKPTLLIVDDNSEILSFLSKVLSSEYFVISAQSGEEALQILSHNRIDVAISDVVMGEMNGFELCRKIKSDINMSHIPVILLTAKSDTDSKVEGLDAGADAYIEKPFVPSHIQAQLRNLLRKIETTQRSYASDPLVAAPNIINNKLDEEFIARCTEIILNNLSDGSLTVTQLAQQLNMSRTSIFTKIKGIMGVTPNEFIKITRLKEASKMMLEGKYRITEIGFLVGFSSSSYFAKCFSSQFGMLPTDFIKKMKQESADEVQSADDKGKIE